MTKSRSLVCLDVGEKRIGVAIADTAIRIAIPYETIPVDGAELTRIIEIITQEHADVLVIGYPRNQQGEATAQSKYVEQFATQFHDTVSKIEFQDESLTSVLAEDRLKEIGSPYQKGDIDMQAAAIILQDYIEAHYG
jgi:putative holliday junction resolvase